ncbi:MAG: outer membrane beta-barrel protein [Candidatus Zhuqueibacterota bacterium]
MRRLAFIPIAMMVLASSSPAQWSRSAMTVKFGNFSPKDIGPSYVISANFMFHLSLSDELGFGVDYYGKHEKDIITLKDKYLVGPILEKEVQTIARTNVHLIPVYAQYLFRMPISPRNTACITGTAGYNFLISKFTDYYDESKSIMNQYQGFRWTVGLGILYRLNHHMQIACDAAYNYSKVSRDISATGSAPTEAVVDISGFSFLIGLRRSLF